MTIFVPSNNEHLKYAVSDWITNRITTQSISGNINTWDVSEITDMSGLFKDTDFGIHEYDIIDDWNVENVTNMSYMFYNATTFNGDISNWNVENVVKMDYMFALAISFNQNLSNWIVSQIPNKPIDFKGGNYMFNDENQPYWGIFYVPTNEKLKLTVDIWCQDSNKNTTINKYGLINNWNVSKITDMSGLFQDTNFGIHPFDIIDNWNVENVTNMDSMFKNATLFNGSIGNWNVDNVINMDNMFNGAIIFNKPINSWNIYKLFNATGMFSGAVSFNQPLDNWYMGSIANLSNLFNGALSFNNNISSWRVGGATNMSNMFCNAITFNQPLDEWNVESVTNMQHMFFNAITFNQSLNSWNVEQVTDMSGMFNNALTFNQPLDNWNVTNVTNMERMFQAATIFNQNISSWNVVNISSKPTNFKEGAIYFLDENQPLWNIFTPSNNEHLKLAVLDWLDDRTSVEDISGNINTWNVSKITDMSGLFVGSNFGISDNSLVDIIEDWDVGNVLDMSGMFYNANHFNCDISSWNVGNTTNMDYMFYNASSFNQPIHEWDVQNVINMENMFYSASSFNQNISSWNVSHISSQPTNFDLNANTNWSSDKKPQWGDTQSIPYDYTVYNLSIVEQFNSLYVKWDGFVGIDNQGNQTTHYVGRNSVNNIMYGVIRISVLQMPSYSTAYFQRIFDSRVDKNVINEWTIPQLSSNHRYIVYISALILEEDDFLGKSYPGYGDIHGVPLTDNSSETAIAHAAAAAIRASAAAESAAKAAKIACFNANNIEYVIELNAKDVDGVINTIQNAEKKITEATNDASNFAEKAETAAEDATEYAEDALEIAEDAAENAEEEKENEEISSSTTNAVTIAIKTAEDAVIAASFAADAAVSAAAAADSAEKAQECMIEADANVDAYYLKDINFIKSKEKCNTCIPKTNSHINQLSNKRLRSKMLQFNRSITYNNSKTNQIIKKIQSLDEDINKKLLLQLGKRLYDKYFQRIVRSTRTNDNDKAHYTIMYNRMISELTYAQQSKLGIYVQTEAQKNYLIQSRNINLVENPDFIFYCKTSTIGLNENLEWHNIVITNIKRNQFIYPGKKYKFDLSHPSNIGHKLSFSEKKYQFKDVNNIYFIGTPGYPDACIIYKPDINISLYKVFLYDKLDLYRNSFDFFPLCHKTLPILPKYKTNSVLTYTTTPNMVCLPSISELRIVVLDGPKFFLEDSSVHTRGNIFKDRYDPNRQYGLHEGTYVIIQKDFSNPITIINKNMEHLIQLIGNPNKKSTFYLQGLSDDVNDTSLDGLYNFYYGTIFMDVGGDFGECGIYSKKYGFNTMERILTYTSLCNNVTGRRLDIQDIENSFTIISNTISENDSAYATATTTITDVIIENSIDLLESDMGISYDIYNTPNNFTTILAQSISPTITTVTNFADLDRVLIYSESSYVAINNSFSITNITSIDTHNDLLASTFQVIEDVSDSGYYRLDSELHSLYSLDIVNDELVFSDAWSINRTSDSGYVIFALTTSSLTPYKRYAYSTSSDSDSDHYPFEEDSTFTNTTTINVTFNQETTIDLSIPTDFNPIPVSYATNSRVSWEDSNITSIDSNDHYNGNTVSKISSTYSSQVAESGTSSSTEYAAISMLSEIVDTGVTLRYDINLYLAFRKALLSCTLQSNTIINGELGMNTVPYVYFTNELSGTEYHPFMVIASYSISEGPNRLIDVPFPPGDGLTSSYSNQSVTRDAKLSNYLIKIPLRDYGTVTSVTDNDLTTSSGYNNLRDDDSSSDNYSVYNYASISSIGIAIDGVLIYPVLNNTLTVAQEKAEITNTGIHVGQGLQLHYHADGHGATDNSFNLYNSSDYEDVSHPPLIGFGYDGIALFGKYETNYNNMYGYDVDLDDFGGHTHDDDDEAEISYGYHYHAHEVESSDSGINNISSTNYTIHVLMKGAWAGDINNIPNFWNGTSPKVKGTDIYTGS